MNKKRGKENYLINDSCVLSTYFRGKCLELQHIRSTEQLPTSKIIQLFDLFQIKMQSISSADHTVKILK